MPILHFWGPYAKLFGGGGGGVRLMNEWNAFVRVRAVSNHAHGKRLRNGVSSAAWYDLKKKMQLFFFNFFFLSRARHCMTFTLQDLTDCYVERSTAHRIKRNEWTALKEMFSQPLAKFKNETKMISSLRARGPPGVSGALRSLRTLRIGRIGSVYMGLLNAWIWLADARSKVCNYFQGNARWT